MSNPFIGSGDDQDHLLACEPEASAPAYAPGRVSGPMVPLAGDEMTDISIRASAVVGGDPAFLNPPKYPLDLDGNIDTPEALRQPQFHGIARQTWQSILVYGLPYARLHGLPGPAEVIPGLSGPLNPEELAALAALLDAQAP